VSVSPFKMALIIPEISNKSDPIRLARIDEIPSAIAFVRASINPWKLQLAPTADKAVALSDPKRRIDAVFDGIMISHAFKSKNSEFSNVVVSAV